MVAAAIEIEGQYFVKLFGLMGGTKFAHERGKSGETMAILNYYSPK